MHKLRKRLSVLMLGVLLMFGCSNQVVAKEATTDVKTTGDTSLEAAKDSVVQVVIDYVDEQGNIYILKSGSGFLISNNVVITNNHLVTLTEEEKVAAGTYLTGLLGKEISFVQTESGNVAAYQVSVVVLRDVMITATVNSYSSKEMDLGILNLSDTMKRSTAVLGDSDQIEADSTVYTIGYKTVSAMSGSETELLAQDDLKTKEGTFTGLSDDTGITCVTHTAAIKEGSAGGILTDEQGHVLGMNIYESSRPEGSNTYRSLAVNEIKTLLDSCEVTYQEAAQIASADTNTEINEAATGDVDTTLLDNYIVNLNMLSENDYTSESYMTLETALANARAVKGDEGATQEEVDLAVTELEQAKASLVKAKHVNWPVIIAVIVAVVAVITALVLYILKIKGVIGGKKQPEHLMTLSEIQQQQMRPSVPDVAIPKPRQTNVSRPMAGGTSGDMNGTTVLQPMSVQEGTVVLGVSGSVTNAYLTRRNTSEKITINCDEFILGKDQVSANYCILNNPSISRRHAKIVKRAGAYYIVDLHSTNFTYLNGKIVMADEEVEIKNGDVIRLSNEEFSFNIS